MTDTKRDTAASPNGSALSDLLGLVERLRAPSMMDTTATYIDRMRMAADEIERLRAELARCGGDNCMGRRCDDVTNWVTEQAAQARVAAERERWRDELAYAEAALADIGDADREPGDDLAWCEARAAEALPRVRAALKA